MTFIVREALEEPYFIGMNDLSLSETIDINRRGEISRIFKTGSGLLKAEELPTQARSYHKALRDEFRSINGMRIVSPAFRDMLEAIEPGTHQFVPLQIIFAAKSETRYILNVHVSQDTIIDARSDVSKHPDAENIMYFNSMTWGKAPVRVTINAASRGRHNLWRERRYPGSLLVSDRLQAEITRRRLRVFQMFKASDV